MRKCLPLSWHNSNDKVMESKADTELYRGYEWGSSGSPGICQTVIVFPSVTLA